MNGHYSTAAHNRWWVAGPVTYKLQIPVGAGFKGKPYILEKYTGSRLQRAIAS